MGNQEITGLALLQNESRWRTILFTHSKKKKRKGLFSMTHDTTWSQESPVSQPAEQIVAFLHEVLRPLPSEGEPAVAPRRRGRPRVLSCDHLWLAMVIAIVRGFTGYASVWRLITWTGVGSFPLLDLTRAAVRKRLLHSDLCELHGLLTRMPATLGSSLFSTQVSVVLCDLVSTNGLTSPPVSRRHSISSKNRRACQPRPYPLCLFHQFIP